MAMHCCPLRVNREVCETRGAEVGGKNSDRYGWSGEEEEEDEEG